MLNELHAVCDKTHVHEPLLSGKPKLAETYPLKLVVAILRGMQRTMEARNVVAADAEAEYDHVPSFAVNTVVDAGVLVDPGVAACCSLSKADPAGAQDLSVNHPDAPLPTSEIPLRSGGMHKMQFTIDAFKPVYKDEYTGDELPHKLVRDAMIEELQYFNRIVWEPVPVQDAKADSEDFRPIRTRWVISNKGDRQNPDIRARLVACEVAHSRNDSYYASTPPLEAKRLLFSIMASTRKDSQTC